MPGVGEVFEYLSRLREPLRIPNLSNHIGTLGLPDVRLPIEVSSILTAPIRYRGLVVGSIYLGRNFEDEESPRRMKKSWSDLPLSPRSSFRTRAYTERNGGREPTWKP